MPGSHGHRTPWGGCAGARVQGRRRSRASSSSVVWALLPASTAAVPAARPGQLHEDQASELADGVHLGHAGQLLLFLHLQDDSDP